MKPLLNIQFSSTRCHLLSLWHPILKQPEVMLLPQYCTSLLLYTKTANICERWVCQNGVAEDSCLLWCDTESLGQWLPKFRRIVLPSPSAANSLRRMDSLLPTSVGEGITILRKVGRHSPKDTVSKYLQLLSDTSHAVRSEQACLPTSNTGWIQQVEQTLPAELPPSSWTATPPEPRQPRRRHRSSWGPSHSSPASVVLPFPHLKHKFEHPVSWYCLRLGLSGWNFNTSNSCLSRNVGHLCSDLKEIDSVLVSAVSVSVATVAVSLL